ncbi:MAG: IclR family transcriptional regulator [Ilumatobacteraceae bacterium]
MSTEDRPESGEERRPGIAVLNRAIDILDAFTSGPGTSFSLAELSRRTGLPKPTVHRFLAALEHLGLVEKIDSNYQLGLRLFELGERVPRKHALREAALPFMQDLYEATHETVHLAVLQGVDVVYLERIRGHRSARVDSRVGGRLPAASTGVGKAILAFDAAARQRTIAAPLIARTPYTITDPSVLLTELDRIAESGVAFDREENSIGVNCAAAPILFHDRAIGAVSVTGSPAHLDVDRIASAVRTAALGIQRTLTARHAFRGGDR